MLGVVNEYRIYIRKITWFLSSCFLYQIIEPYSEAASFYLYVMMYETPAMACRSQVWIFFCAGHCDPPHTLPGLVQLAVYGIHP